MNGSGTPAGRRAAWPLVLALLGLVVLAAAAVFGLRVAHLRQQAANLRGPAAPALAPPHPAPAPSPPPGPPPPSFDIVRIAPNGDAVLAGRAAPGAEVSVLADGKPVGHATADASGAWAMTTDASLPPGGHELTLSERLPGAPEVASAGSVVAVVPTTSAAPAIALLAQPGAASRVLQAPPTPAAPAASASKERGLGLATVDYDERGVLRFAGAAPPGRAVRVYVDDAPVGDATADAAGRWTLAASGPVPVGPHTLRIDQIDAKGAVTARIELPFQREQLGVTAMGDSRVIVMPGESLWRLARLGYGSGLRYTVIYQANQSQIRDPNKIYPGQAFTLPSR
ncbi:MAG: LysM peptidoglycan-binding domain-containing protein [Proteobacteria bacterium]|nr:LysM peptidoglycan-binding domain-containing protein [Pseudomonadota bacterium]